jgi:hypothetical protein
VALEEFRERLDRILADLERRVGGGRAAAGGLYDALVETRAAAAAVRDAIAATERELAAEQSRLADAERRGRLARDIDDQETVELARIWSDKHRERVGILERKLAVQGDELVYAERQAEELKQALQQARTGVPPVPAVSPEADGGLDREGRELDRQAREAMVQAQLAALKKKLGRDG